MLLARDLLEDQSVFRAPRESYAAPRISVILPTYNRARGLETAISAALAQTYSDLELLVVDDGSTDDTFDVIEQLRARDPRVIHVRNARNIGLAALSLNTGISLARGQYIVILSQETCWRPHALQALLRHVRSGAEPTVVVGLEQVGERVTPGAVLNLVRLYERNEIANATVLFPRRLVERLGMFDSHIALRDGAAWDLWLRYIRHVPFVTTAEIIADIAPGVPNAVFAPSLLFYYLHEIPREGHLSISAWRDQAVDALQIGDFALPPEFRRQVYDEHLVPFFRDYANDLPPLADFVPAPPSDYQTVLYTKNAYDVSNDVTLAHYDAVARSRGMKSYFVPLPHVSEDWSRAADALLLVRTGEDRSRALLDDALGKGIPAGFYLDDDLLHFYEYGGPDYHYLEPGTPYYETLQDVIRRSDAVWVTNHFIRESVASLNPRVIPHNNAVPERMLPRSIRPHEPGKPWLIGYTGSAYRLQEFTQLWDALVAISRRFQDHLVFGFWGVEISALPSLNSPTYCRPFSFSYPAYLKRLQEASFDILLTPLLDTPRPRLAKSLIKYYETAVAGALGIYSDVPQYASLPAGETCLKAANTPDAWYAVLHEALTMRSERFDSLRGKALAHVRGAYTETAQIDLHEAAWRATEFHARTRARRGEDGRPRIMCLLPSPESDETEIRAWQQLLSEYGVEPVAVKVTRTASADLRTLLAGSSSLPA